MIYKPKKIESTFIELILLKRDNSIIGCIHRHPCLDIFIFNDRYLNLLLDKVSKVSKVSIIF